MRVLILFILAFSVSTATAEGSNISVTLDEQNETGDTFSGKSDTGLAVAIKCYISWGVVYADLILANSSSGRLDTKYYRSGRRHSGALNPGGPSPFYQLDINEICGRKVSREAAIEMFLSIHDDRTARVIAK